MNYRLLILLIIVAAVAGAIIFLWLLKKNDTSSPVMLSVNDSMITPNSTPAPTSTRVLSPISSVSQAERLTTPLDRASKRVSKKKFGQYITPADSPIQPERFSGYHTGVDFEIFPEELNEAVAVKAVCTGKLERKETVSGYGGVIIESCILNSEPVTVLYGHLKLAGISKNVGDDLAAGEAFAVLGDDKSSDTDGERKHLHLGIHRGTEINVKGYVSKSAELSGWIDPCEYVCQYR